MENPIRPYIYEIGKTLANLGNELCLQANSPAPLNIHGVAKSSLDNICFYLHNMTANLNVWRKEMSERNSKFQMSDVSHRTDDVDVESIYSAVVHLLNSNYTDVDSGIEHCLNEELQKLEWLMADLQDKPKTIRHSNAIHEDFTFDKISGDR